MKVSFPVKDGFVRYNPDLIKGIDTTSLKCLADLFVCFNNLYGKPLKQIAEVNDGKVSWTERGKLYKVELTFTNGNWVLFGRKLNLSESLLNKLTFFYNSLRSNETYLFDHPMEELFISHRDYYDKSDRHICGLTISKIRFIPTVSKNILYER